MISTTCAQQPYFILPITRKHILKIALRPEQTKQSFNESCFVQERLSRRHTARPSRYRRSSISNIMALSQYFELFSGYLRSLYRCKKEKGEG